MRVFARRERPHPGAQLSLFETQDGWRYSLWVSNVPAGLRGWRAQLGYIDAAHRVHARVEDCIRTGKDCGIGRFPSHDFAMNSAWLAASLMPRPCCPGCGSSPWTATWPAPSRKPCVTGSCMRPGSWSAAAAAGG